MKRFGLGAIAALMVLPASGVLAADLMDPVPIVDDGTLVSPFAGGYFGGNLGYSWGPESAANHPTFTISGFTVGGQVGYMMDLGNGFMVGGEGDANWTNAAGSDNIAVEAKVNWTASLTARAGYSIGDTVMPYVLGGLAVGNATGKVVVGPVGTDTQTFAGWTVGAGAEVKLVENVTAFAEYRYTDYGTKTFTVAGIATPQTYRENAIRTGINFHF